MIPGARRTAIEGTTPRADGGSALKVALTAPPVEGKANAALVALLARTFALAKRDVEILRGQGDRWKVVLLRGETQGLARRAKSLY